MRARDEDSPFGEGSTPRCYPLVLFRTPFFGRSPLDQVAWLDVKDHFTFDQERLRETDVVVFHVPEFSWVEFDDSPTGHGVNESLGWEPSIGLRAGVESVYAWFLENGPP